MQKIKVLCPGRVDCVASATDLLADPFVSVALDVHVMTKLKEKQKNEWRKQDNSVPIHRVQRVTECFD